MSNQNDLDDQLYILLASMKEYREAIADDNKRLETFYNKVASGVLEQSKKTLNNANQEATFPVTIASNTNNSTRNRP